MKAFLALGSLIVLAACAQSLTPAEAPRPAAAEAAAEPSAGSRPQAGEPFSTSALSDVLHLYVNEKGLVAYAELKQNRRKLDEFAEELARLDPAVYESWDEKAKIAFWINAYNALVLKLIVDHYPIKASLLKSVVHPKNSIQQIPGAFNGVKFTVMGQAMTLDDIEHGVLRKSFAEPRIHMALVCAAKGCPFLRAEPYTGEKLDEQLDEQTKRFLADPQKFRVDKKKGVVYLSSIFKWFGGDFVSRYGTDAFRGNDAQKAVLHFISGYVDYYTVGTLKDGRYEIQYLDYDWSLNEQRKK